MDKKRDRRTSVYRAIADPDRVGWLCPRCPQSNPLHHGLIKCDGCDFPLDQFKVRVALGGRSRKLTAEASCQSRL